MPQSKTIEIDEIITPEKPPGDDPKRQPGGPKPSDGASRDSTSSGTSDNPFADFQKALPWKARITLKLTQWFMLLRSKSWGKFVIVPAIVLALILAIPLGLLFFCFLIIRSMFRPR